MGKDFFIVHQALVSSVTILNKCAFSMQRMRNEKAIKGLDLLSEALIESSEMIKKDKNTSLLAGGLKVA